LPAFYVGKHLRIHHDDLLKTLAELPKVGGE
jgi:hypothetical protein